MASADPTGVPIPVRFMLGFMIAFGAVGGVIGLVIGLRSYPPTAWAAFFEIGAPSAFLGAVLGLLIGAVVTGGRALKLRRAPR